MYLYTTRILLLVPPYVVRGRRSASANRLVTTQISISSWHKDSKATHMMRFCVIPSLFGISAINQEDLK